MVIYAALAVIAGLLVSLSRQINGRLSLSTSPMESSFWNHIVGFAILSVIALIFGGLFPADKPLDPPLVAYISGPLGVVFVALSSWLVARIGAAQTAILIIAGQMISGVVLDLIQNAPGNPIARVAGVGFILLGMWLTQAPAKPND